MGIITVISLFLALNQFIKACISTRFNRTTEVAALLTFSDFFFIFRKIDDKNQKTELLKTVTVSFSIGIYGIR